MKKKFSIFFVALIVFMIMQVFFAGKVQALTAQEYKDKINAILSTWEGKQFNSGSWYGDHNSFYSCSKCGYGAWECLAFARYVQNQFYGCCERCGNLQFLYSGSINSITDLRVGDGFRYNGGYGWNHSVIIIDVEASNNRARVMDCNYYYDDHIVRQRYMDFSEIKSKLNTPLANVNGEYGSPYIMRSPGNNVITTSDTQAPTLHECYVEMHNITSSSYKVVVKASDNVGIARVAFPTWTSTNGQDDVLWKDGTYNSTYGQWEFTVRKSDHNNSVDTYNTHVYIYDAAGNYAMKGLDSIPMGSTVANLGDFTARIALNTNTSYALGIAGTSNGSKVQLENKSQTDDTQLWKFTRNSDGSYNIENVATGMALDVDGASDNNEAKVQICRKNSTVAQQFYIMNYNGAYRIVARCSASLRAIDVFGLSIKNGAEVGLYMANSLANEAQTWKFEKPNTTANVQYTTHVQNIGWQNYVSNGQMAGTSGKGLRLEGIKIKLNSGYSGSVQYATHVENIGWQNYVYNDAVSGTSGKGLRLEAIKINLTGTISNYYDIYYRVHAQNVGWLDWAKNGQEAGTVGYGYRLEGIEIVLVAKGGAAPGKTTNPVKVKAPNVEYTTHVQNIGWQNYVSNGQMAGTSGRGLRLEGIKIRLSNQNVSGNVEYSTHVQNIGWQSYVSNDAISGTNGRGLRLEAIKIRLTGTASTKYDIYYRVHAENAGWLGWAKNGQESGTSGYGFRLEGIEIVIVEKGSAAPGSTANRYLKKVASAVVEADDLLKEDELTNEVVENTIIETDNVIENNVSNENVVIENTTNNENIIDETINNVVVPDETIDEDIENDVENDIEDEIEDETEISNEIENEVSTEENTITENVIVNTINVE